MLFLFLLSMLFTMTLGLPAANQTDENVPFTKESWDNYQVDAWLANFMQTEKLSPANFIHDFSLAVHGPLNCGLDQPCTHVPNVTTNSPKEVIQTTLVLASLTHFNDLFRMISRLWSNDPFLDNPINPGYPFRTVLVEQFSDLYAYFSVSDLSSRVPPELTRVFLNSIWYIPYVIPNAALVATIDNVMATVKVPNWVWKDYAHVNALGTTNIEQSVEDIFEAWRQQHDSVVGNRGGTNILDFIKGGQMLEIKYARELTTVGWHTQAFLMFTRQILSLVLEANGVLVHRADYDNMQPSDTAMDLDFSHDDPYTHETYSPIHFGVDKEGNITRQYSPSKPDHTFDAHQIPERVVWGQSWQCFEATNNNKFTANFVRAWSLPAYRKSLFIPNWDGTIDSFDANNPPCTFNLAVNNQPADIKTSWYIQQLSDSCSGQISEIMNDYITVDYPLYRAVMFASDAWVYSAVFNQGSNVSESMAEACQAADNTTTAMTQQVWDDWNSNFRFNMALGLLAHVGDILGRITPIANSIKSSIRGGWTKLFAEKPPVVQNRPPAPPQDLVEPPKNPPTSPDDESGGQKGGEQNGNKGIEGIKGEEGPDAQNPKEGKKDGSKVDAGGKNEASDSNPKGDEQMVNQVNKNEEALQSISGL